MKTLILTLFISVAASAQVEILKAEKSYSTVITCNTVPQMMDAGLNVIIYPHSDTGTARLVVENITIVGAEAVVDTTAKYFLSEEAEFYQTKEVRFTKFINTVSALERSKEIVNAEISFLNDGNEEKYILNCKTLTTKFLMPKVLAMPQNPLMPK